MRRLLDQDSCSLFGAHPGSARIQGGADLTAPTLTDPMDAETEREIER